LSGIGGFLGCLEGTLLLLADYENLTIVIESPETQFPFPIEITDDLHRKSLTYLVPKILDDWIAEQTVAQIVQFGPGFLIVLPIDFEGNRFANPDARGRFMPKAFHGMLHRGALWIQHRRFRGDKNRNLHGTG